MVSRVLPSYNGSFYERFLVLQRSRLFCLNRTRYDFDKPRTRCPPLGRRQRG